MTTATAFKELALSEIKESKTNPRRTFSVKGLEELEASIQEKGILNPLLVRPVNGHFELVAGARRYRAAKKVGLEAVPVIVRELDDDQALEVQVIENLQREGIHPLEEAEGYEALLKRPGYDVKAIASKVGKSEQYVYAKLKLAALAEKAKKAFLSDLITEGHATLIARLGQADQVKALGVCTVEGWQAVADGEVGLGRFKRPITVRELSAWISKELQLNLSAAPWKKDDAELVAEAGPCSTCPKRTGRAEADLFPDVKGGERCNDRSCFQEKFVAWIKRHEKEAKAAGSQFVAVSTLSGYQYEESMAKGYAHQAASWREAKSGCKDVYVGLAVDGKRVGQTFNVCVGNSCDRCAKAKVAAASRSSYSVAPRKMTEAEKAKRRTEIFEAKVGREHRKELIRKIAACSTKVPTGARLRHLVSQFLGNVDHSKRRKFMEWKDWQGSRASYQTDYEKLFEKRIEGLKDEELWPLFSEIVLASSIEYDWDESVATWAEACGVDSKKTRADVVKLLKAPKQKGAADAEKEKPAAKKK